MEVVAGFFQPDATTPFEIALGATVLPALADIAPATFLPSSRSCLLYTSDAADERSSVDLGGRRIIKKKKSRHISCMIVSQLSQNM